MDYLINLPKPLSSEDNRKLLIQSKNDENAKEKFLSHNLRLVIHVLYKNMGLPMNEILDKDYFTVGYIGLVKAVETFDTDKTIAFTTYAVRCIMNEINMERRKERRRNEILSFNDNIGPSELHENDTILLQDVVPSKENISEEVAFQDEMRTVRAVALSEAERILDPQEKAYIKRIYGFDGKGGSQGSNAAREIGIPKHKFSNFRFKKIKYNNRVKERLVELQEKCEEYKFTEPPASSKQEKITIDFEF